MLDLSNSHPTKKLCDVIALDLFFWVCVVLLPMHTSNYKE